MPLVFGVEVADVVVPVLVLVSDANVLDAGEDELLVAVVDAGVKSVCWNRIWTL